MPSAFEEDLAPQLCARFHREKPLKKRTHFRGGQSTEDEEVLKQEGGGCNL